MKKLYFSLFTLLFFFSANAQIVNIPDPVFKAKLLSATYSNGIASSDTPYYNPLNNTWSGTSSTVIDTNNDGEIQLSEASVIKMLLISNSSITNLTGIESFQNLVYFKCDHNLITNLNISNSLNLRYLECNYNQLSNLNVANLSNLMFLYCNYNELPSLDVSDLTSLERLECKDNLLVSLDFSGISNVKYLFCPFNPMTSLNVSSLVLLNYLHCGSMNLQNINLQNSINLDYLQIDYNNLTSLDISNCTNLATLHANSNELISLNIKNNNMFYYNNTFSIHNNPTLQYVCVDESELTQIQGFMNQYPNCQVNSYCSFTPGGTFYNIQGNTYYDFNTNGCDINDTVYSNLKLNITDGTNSGVIISNSSGNYSIPLSAGTYTLTPQFENPSYYSISPISSTITVPGTVNPITQNFCITANGVHSDLETYILPLNAARPGFDASYIIKYKNKGNQVENATLVFNYDDNVLDLVSASNFPVQSTSSLSWNLGSLNPFQQGGFLVTLNLNSPMETPALNSGNILNYTSVINSSNIDEIPIDNNHTLNQTVVNSYDPNDKTCLEGTTINPSMIGEYVHYQIRFENTGTFPAENIVVKDMIDTTKFDIATLQITDASHSCVTRITNPNKVEFIFEDINLPFDDATNDGYVVFKIKTKSTLVVGNTISNLANIYFDYNFPIVTNTATSTFQALATNEFDSNNALTLYPIPVKDNLNFSLKNNEITSSISIYNLLGQLIQTVTNPSNSIDVFDLQSGSYLIKVTTDKGISSGKFIKE